MTVRGYARYLMTMAGLGGLIYGIDVGVCAAAYPYIEKTSTFTPGELGFIVGAVLWGSVASSLFAGALSEWLGRKKVIILSALFFTASIPVICASGFFEGGNFLLITLGRTLQGASAGLVGVIVPMYLAECLAPADRGKGTGMFQLLLTIGLVFAAVIGLVVVKIVGAADAETVSAAAKTTAWQTIFWCSAVPGVVLFFGAMKLKESPRWLYNRGRRDAALDSLAANNGEEAAKAILDAMIANDEAEAKAKAALAESAKGDTIFQKKYIYPFCLAIVILACNQTTGINSVLNYTVKIFQEAGLKGEFANWGDLTIKVVNMLMTVVACILVDKKGRKFLLKLGTAGIIIGLCGVGSLFLFVQRERINVTDSVQRLVQDKAWVKTSVEEVARSAASGHPRLLTDGKVAEGVQLIVTYRQGDETVQVVSEYFDREAETAKLKAVGLDYVDTAMAAIDVSAARKAFLDSIDKAPAPRAGGEAKLSERIGKGMVEGVPAEKEDDLSKAAQRLEKNGDRVIVDAKFADKPSLKDRLCFWSEPQALGEVRELTIVKAELGVKPGMAVGWLVTACFMFFIAAFAVGPGVCAWLALSELMPARIRANGMSIGMIINQGVSATIASVFPAWVAATSFATVFYILAGFTVVYLVTVTFFLPETKGKTLEEIEAYFSKQ